MKCISLWQPWASALFLRYNGKPLKPDETRGWPTAFRGRIAIHAAKRQTKPGADYDPELDRILTEICRRRTADLPRGCVLGTVELVACRRASEVYPKRSAAQLLWGDYRERDDDGKPRFAWTVQEPQLLPCSIPWKGAQGFFDVPDALFAKLTAPDPEEFVLTPPKTEARG